jgi:glycosyltransferase involved in cell wall biosynthesis
MKKTVLGFGEGLHLVAEQSSLRILMLSTSLPTGPDDFRGAFVMDMAQALTALGHKVSIITPSPGLKTPLIEDRDGIHIRRVPVLNPGKGASLFGRFGVVETLAQHPWLAWQVLPAAFGMAVGCAGMAAKHDVIISHWALPSGLIAAGLRRIGGPPHLLVEHGGGLRLLKALPGPVASKIFAWIAGGSDRIQCVASYMLEDLRRLDEDAAKLCFVSPTGIPAPDETVPPDAPPLPLRILFVGRMVEQKGPQHLLAAVSNLDESTCTFVGDGPMLPKLRQEAQQMGIAARAVFLGELPPVALGKVMARHNILVCPSLPLTNGQEGTPTALLKGMAAGLLPIASRTGGIPDIVSHGVNGLLVPPGDSRSLARALIGLMDKPERIQEMAAAARTKGQEFIWPNLVESLDRTLRDMLSLP